MSGTGVAAIGIPGKIASIDGLGEIVPAALNPASSATIYQHYLRCMRIIGVYGSGATYSIKEFKEWAHKAHRQISNGSEW